MVPVEVMKQDEDEDEQAEEEEKGQRRLMLLFDIWEKNVKNRIINYTGPERERERFEE